ncbi:hypothetical protein CC80DRAFT_577961 [Byssothecium circinans]|uniref:Uncharacterized protein n=1 Tax=Byssothecium circinans TaxID=147558 RepID=A0A6A5U9Q4_9PLEO|nr:hypothetical protein CC80DRAFT_577961 [Byssothecium circinans]
MRSSEDMADGTSYRLSMDAPVSLVIDRDHVDAPCAPVNPFTLGDMVTFGPDGGVRLDLVGLFSAFLGATPEDFFADLVASVSETNRAVNGEEWPEIYHSNVDALYNAIHPQNSGRKRRSNGGSDRGNNKRPRNSASFWKALCKLSAEDIVEDTDISDLLAATNEDEAHSSEEQRFAGFFNDDMKLTYIMPSMSSPSSPEPVAPRASPLDLESDPPGYMYLDHLRLRSSNDAARRIIMCLHCHWIAENKPRRRPRSTGTHRRKWRLEDYRSEWGRWQSWSARSSTGGGGGVRQSIEQGGIAAAYPFTTLEEFRAFFSLAADIGSRFQQISDALGGPGASLLLMPHLGSEMHIQHGTRAINGPEGQAALEHLRSIGICEVADRLQWNCKIEEILSWLRGRYQEWAET